MLQQTTVATVQPYYTRFLAAYPTVDALAKAPRDDVLARWAGLGYYTRARNLHRCAQIVAEQGGFPISVAGLEALPGIGAYTARAIAAIAFGAPVVPVDGNVERVTARVFDISEPLPAARRILAQHANTLNTDPAARARPGDFAQALFDLGATICVPRDPACGLCPWMGECAARAAGTAALLPRKTPRAAKPERYGVAYVLEDARGMTWLRRRPEKGLLAGMAEFPGTPWRETPWDQDDAAPFVPHNASFRRMGHITHVFTHLTLRLDVMFAHVTRLEEPEHGYLWPLEMLDQQAFPTLMRKCAKLARPTALLEIRDE